MDMRDVFDDILTREIEAEEKAVVQAEHDLLVARAKRGLGLASDLEVALAADIVDASYERAATRLLRFRRWVAAPAEG